MLVDFICIDFVRIMCIIGGANGVRYREIVKILKQNGWYVKESKGSHIQFVHPLKKGKVTVPFHGGDVRDSIVHSIEKQTGIDFKDYKKGERKQ